MEVKIDRVAFSLFGVDIMWYAIIICFGIMAGLFVATKNSKLRNIKEDDICITYKCYRSKNILCNI